MPISMTLLANSLAIGIFWLLFYSFFGFFHDIYRKSRIRELLYILTTSFLGTVIIFFVLLLDDEGVVKYTFYYKTFGSYYLIHVSFVGFSMLVFLSYTKALIRDKKLFFNTLLIGSSRNAREIFQEVEKSYEVLGLKFIGFVQVFESEPEFLDLNLRSFGSYTNLEKLVRRCSVKHVIIAVEPSEHQKITEILNLLAGYNVRISIIPDIYQVLLGSVRVNHIFGIPLMEINQDLIPVWQKTVKRAIDISVSLLVLITGIPFLLVIALVIKLTSRGPVFYFQERIGKDGRPFNIIKFRSMYADAEKTGPALSSSDDPRITPWGRVMRKTRIDEFPQFYNVLKGDMSLVGPRPERQFFINQIVQIAPHYRHLHKVRPGITSLGQVKYGYAENVEEMVKRLKYDILYIENMSPTMDFRIIVYTLLIMFQGRGK